MNEEDIKNIEEMLEFKIDIIKYHAWVGTKVINSVENLLTRYKQLDSLIGEIDNKEVNDALHMLLHCALKNTEYETQKQQFQIVNAYIKQLEEENENLKNDLQHDGLAHKYLTLKATSIPKSKIEDKIEELKKKVEELTDDKGYWGGSDLLEQIKVLQELLEKEK